MGLTVNLLVCNVTFAEVRGQLYRCMQERLRKYEDSPVPAGEIFSFFTRHALESYLNYNLYRLSYSESTLILI